MVEASTVDPESLSGEALAQALEHASVELVQLHAQIDSLEHDVRSGPYRRRLKRIWVGCYVIALVVGTSAGFFSCRSIARSAEQSQELARP